MKKSAAVLAVLTCILGALVTGIAGCADQCIAETETTAETIEAIETLAPVETDEITETDGSPDTVPSADPGHAEAEITPALSLTREMTAQTIEPSEVTDEAAVAITQFALDLAKQQDGQFLLSPVSVVSALAMTANGADGDTLAQTEAVLGLDRDTLNRTVHGYMAKNGDKIALANSVWCRSRGFAPKAHFLQTAVDYYGADLFTAPFDNNTINDVNNWISGKTKGMIPRMLNEIDPDTVMYLINAVYFEHQWDTPYAYVSDGQFTAAAGEVQNVNTLCSIETGYYEDDHAVGFAKAYKWCGYSFIALLPEEGMTPSEYLAQLTGEQLHDLLKNPQNLAVQTEMPRFTVEYETDLAEDLAALGMTDIFDSEKADLTGLGTASGNLYVSDVKHKAVMELDENGTKAAAATIVAVVEECEVVYPDPVKTIILDRPFVYMIADNASGIPLFIGTLESVK